LKEGNENRFFIYPINFLGILEHDLAVSDITGISIMSDRVSDKLLELFSKYKLYKERKLLLGCSLILVSQATQIK
jgi:hypothetical protein